MNITDFQKLSELAHNKLRLIDQQSNGQASVSEYLMPSSYDKCKARLDFELQEIKKKDEAWLFLRFYKAVKHKKIEPIEKNEHNLFIWWVLGVCSNINFDKSPAFTEAEFPDVDIDYHPVVREYLKDDFTFRQYGKQHVSNIGNYQTYGVRSSLIDMARVLGYDRDEINFITKRMGMKDDEGDDVTFEGLEETFKLIEQKENENKVLTNYEKIAKELRSYKREHEDVWEAAKHLVVSQIDWKKFDYKKPPHRKKSMGQHASGLIISSANLPELVPLIVPPGSREQGTQATAWVEGLADTDCSSIGLIKFDYLSLEANAKVAECNRLIMQRHGLNSIWALPGLSNWSDTSYLNDPLALEMANKGDLKGIFQFDSNGIRKLAKKGGVTSFDNLVAYSALYRPGPMDEGMHDEYCDRKNGKKEYQIHPLLQPVLAKTYGILVFQEQVMRVLNIVGDVPLKDCEAVRKAISKKKKDKIEKVKEMFVENGQKKLNESLEYLLDLWAQIEAFAGYGFNLCLNGDCLVYDRVRNNYVKIKDLEEEFSQQEPKVILDSFVDGFVVEDQVIDVFETGEKDVYQIEFDNDILIKCTLNHKFLCSDYKFKTIEEIIIFGLEVLWKDDDSGMKRCKVKLHTCVGKQKTYNITMKSKQHNYAVYGDSSSNRHLFTANSHAVAYTYITARQLVQKAHYPLEFFTAALRSLKTADPRIPSYIQDARKRNVLTNGLDLNKSKFDFEIAENNEIYYGFNKIKGIGYDVANRIVELQPFAGFQDFLNRFGTEAKVVHPLIALNTFKEKDPHTLYLYYEAYKKAVKAENDRIQRNKNSVKNYMNDLASLIGPDRTWEHGFDDNYFGKLRSWLDDKAWIKLCSLKKKYDKCIDTFEEKSKNKEDIGKVLSINTFITPSHLNKSVLLNKQTYKSYKAIKPILKDPEGIAAQIEYYGFPWKNDFEQIPSFKGFTFEDYDIDILRAEPGVALPVEVKIISKEHIASRSGKMWYWRLRVVDSAEPEIQRTITVWEHDYDRFESMFQIGNIVRIRLLPPEPPYPNYSMEGVKPWELRNKNPYGDPQWDFRVVLLGKAVKKQKYIDDEDDSYLISPGRKKKKTVEDNDDDDFEQD